MENVLSNPKAIAWIVSALLIGSTSWLIVEKSSNAILASRLSGFQLKADSLSLKNDSLQADAQKFKGLIDALMNRNDQLDKSLGQATARLSTRDREVRKASAVLNQTKMDHDKLVAVHNEIERQFTALKSSCAQLQQENKALNNKVLLLGDNNRLLNDELMKARQASADNVEIDALNKRGKLNSKAHRVRKVVSTFNLQVAIKEPKFRIFDPTGKILSEQDGSFSWRTIDGGNSSNQSNAASPIRMEVVYLPVKRFTPGLYRIETLNENLHVGSFLVRFR